MSGGQLFEAREERRKGAFRELQGGRLGVGLRFRTSWLAGVLGRTGQISGPSGPGTLCGDP